MLMNPNIPKNILFRNLKFQTSVARYYNMDGITHGILDTVKSFSVIGEVLFSLKHNE